MASNNDPREPAHVVAHEGAMCDDCGSAHGAYPITQRGVQYFICDSCYEYACMVAEVDAGEQEDDFEAEAEADWSDDEPEMIVGSAAWWAAGTQDARDNGAYGLLTSAGEW